MAPMEQWIERYQRRVRIGEFLHRAAEWFAVFLFCWGGAILVSRLWIPQWWPHVLWLGLGAIPAAYGAWWLASRQRQTRAESVARLDKTLGTGGLLMTLSELPDADWAAHLPQPEVVWQNALPRLRPRRFASYLVLPVLFAVGAGFVPLRDTSSPPLLANTAAREATQQLEELLESLDESTVLEEEEKQQFEEEVAKLTAETKQTPLTHEKWETVDALREKMRARVDSAAALLSKLDEAAAQLAKAGLGEGEELSADDQLRLEKDVQDAVEQLTKKGALSSAPAQLRSDLQRLMKHGKLSLPKDPVERQKLLDELREHLDAEQRKLSELRKKCKSCSGSGECKDGTCEGGMCQGNTFSQQAGQRDGKGGRGGITRGRGDAEMTWGDESDKEGTKFREVILPQGFLEDPKDEVLKIERTAPIDEPVANAPRDTQREIDPASGKSTWNRRLSPRHRSVVRKFFDNK